MRYCSRSSYVTLSSWFLTILLICIMTDKVRADCPVSYYPGKTTTGSITANFDLTTQKQQTSYQYPLSTSPKLTIRPSIAVGVVGLGLERKSQQFGYNIQTSFYSSDTVALVFKVKVGTSASRDVWRYIQFKFIFSDDPEILAGTQDVLEFIPTQNPFVFRSSQYIPPSTSSFNYKARAKIFISGVQIVEKRTISAENLLKIDQTIKKIQNLRNYSWNRQLIKKFTKILVSQKSPSLTINQPQYVENSLIRFQIITAEIQIRALSYSYLVYLQRPNQERIYRTIQGSFSTADEQNYAYTRLDHDEMTFIGISGFSYSSDLDQTLGLKINQAQMNNKNLFIPQVEGQFLSFSVQFFGIETLPGSICKTCPGSPLKYYQFCISQCPYGYAVSVNSDGQFICQGCDVQNFFIPSQDGFKCVCASGHYFVSPVQSCTTCPYDCLTCNGNICLTCDPASLRTLNPGTQRCQCRGVGLYDDVNSQARVCIQCNPRCRTCIGPQINQCTSCDPTRTLLNGICRCGQNLVQSSSGICICRPPYALTKNGQCQLASNKCNQNQILVTLSNNYKACRCAAGYTLSISNKCIKQCQSYEEFSYRTQKCQCKQGFIRNESSSICYPCEKMLNQVYNSQTKKCECIQGFQMSISGTCISCPAKSYYSSSSDKCLCIYNFYQLSPSGPCIKCTPDVINNNCQSYNGVSRISLTFDDNQISSWRK